MKRVYAAFLSLYPREYRDLFGPEVLSVFDEAAREHRARGWRVWAWFLATELAGAVVSAGGHWVDRFSARHHRSGPEVARAGRSGTIGIIQEAQNRIDFNLKQMTHAIANHDFVGARAYSVEELKAREDLRRLRDRYGFDDDEMAIR
jgi:hypothetical protein